MVEVLDVSAYFNSCCTGVLNEDVLFVEPLNAKKKKQRQDERIMPRIKNEKNIKAPADEVSIG